jgi:hypothetical protein
MKLSICAVLFIYLLACSPYKKITLTASDRLTKNWQGATEQAVNKAYGSYKEKKITPDGFLLHFDYSYLFVTPLKKTSEFQVKASNQPNSPMIPRSNDTYIDHRSADDSVIKRIDFYFDKSEHVQYVVATGFPDSVYYINRKTKKPK